MNSVNLIKKTKLCLKKNIEIIAYIPQELGDNCKSACKNGILTKYDAWKKIVDVEIVLSTAGNSNLPKSTLEINSQICCGVFAEQCQAQLKSCPDRWYCSPCYKLKVFNENYSSLLPCNNCISDAINTKREELKLTRASRILQIPSNGKPDKNTLELGSISCGAPRWRFFGNSVFHYLDKDHIPIVCEPGKFFVYNVKKEAVLVRLNPTTERTPHLTVPSAWRNFDKRDQLIPNGNIASVPTLGTDNRNPTKPTPNTCSLFQSSNGNTYWIVADCDIYKEGSILSGLTDMSEPEILNILK
jgi:hypothetical protein